MVLFEFNNGSVINLLTVESLIKNGDKYYFNSISGNKYELSEQEFLDIKDILLNKKQENN